MTPQSLGHVQILSPSDSVEPLEAAFASANPPYSDDRPLEMPLLSGVAMMTPCSLPFSLQCGIRLAAVYASLISLMSGDGGEVQNPHPQHEGHGAWSKALWRFCMSLIVEVAWAIVTPCTAVRKARRHRHGWEMGHTATCMGARQWGEARAFAATHTTFCVLCLCRARLRHRTQNV